MLFVRWIFVVGVVVPEEEPVVVVVGPCREDIESSPTESSFNLTCLRNISGACQPTDPAAEAPFVAGKKLD